MNYDINRTDIDKINRVIARADSLAAYFNRPLLPRPAILMDLAICHANGCPIDLDGLLKANDADFSHDVWGIHRHIDRKTGNLLDGFCPRYNAIDHRVNVTEAQS